MMRDDELSLLQELVGHATPSFSSPPGFPRISRIKPFQIAHALERFCNFVLRGLIEARNVHVADPRPHMKLVNAVARNLVAHHVELERLSEPSRRTVILTSVPLGPFSRSATSLVLMLSVAFASTA